MSFVLRFEVLYTQRGLHIKIETNEDLTCYKLNPSKSDQDPILSPLQAPYTQARDTLKSLTVSFQHEAGAYLKRAKIVFPKPHGLPSPEDALATVGEGVGPATCGA